MAIEIVRAFFYDQGIANRILEFPVSSATVELAAQALGCEAKRIAKTLSFLVDGSAVLVVAAGDARVDNAKFKTRFGAKPKMLDVEHVLAATGHAVGGVCPFAIPDGVPVHLDVSLQRFTTVFPACGSSNSAIELTLVELEHYANAMGWVDVCKNWE
ncbi:MAG: YbaK/EbsC family protein [Clostridia bacterium]|nr:YbaK/EbsC family protein [Clostridia bacterium]NCC75009.1 YbaK/EbsC family protein [Clostridia bacterium]